MKKILIGFLLTIYSIGLHAQVIKPVKIDSLITVSLPTDFQKKDTLGQQIYTGTGSLGYIIVIKAPNPAGKPLKKEKDLNKVFKEYIGKLEKQSQGNNSIMNDHDTIINNVEVRDFTLRTDNGQGVQLRKFRILYTRPATYTFQIAYPEERQDLAAKEAKDFFASIKTAPSLDGTDQYSMYGRFTGMHKGLKMGIGAGIVVIIIIIITALRRRKKSSD